MHLPGISARAPTDCHYNNVNGRIFQPPSSPDGPVLQPLTKAFTQITLSCYNLSSSLSVLPFTIFYQTMVTKDVILHIHIH